MAHNPISLCLYLGLSLLPRLEQTNDAFDRYVSRRLYDCDSSTCQNYTNACMAMYGFESLDQVHCHQFKCKQCASYCSLSHNTGTSQAFGEKVLKSRSLSLSPSLPPSFPLSFSLCCRLSLCSRSISADFQDDASNCSRREVLTYILTRRHHSI